MLKNNKNQAGETIVEVLISILIISVALAGAFAISNRSQKTVQANQERYQAQIYANSQADLLKTYLTGTGARSSTYSSAFCMESGSSVKASSDSLCTKDSLYNITIQCQNNVSSVCSTSNTAPYNTYKITVTWDSLINNGGKDNVELWYGV